MMVAVAPMVVAVAPVVVVAPMVEAEAPMLVAVASIVVAEALVERVLGAAGTLAAFMDHVEVSVNSPVVVGEAERSVVC